MTQPIWYTMPNYTLNQMNDALGIIPTFLNDAIEQSAKEQLNDNYVFGGGWRPLEGFVFDPDNNSITYPNDDPLFPIAATKLRDEVIMIYPFAWVLILHKDGSYEVAGMD